MFFLCVCLVFLWLTVYGQRHSFGKYDSPRDKRLNPSSSHLNSDLFVLPLPQTVIMLLSFWVLTALCLVGVLGEKEVSWCTVSGLAQYNFYCIWAKSRYALPSERIHTPSLFLPIMSKGNDVFWHFRKLVQNEKLKCLESISIRPLCYGKSHNKTSRHLIHTLDGVSILEVDWLWFFNADTD